MLSDAAVAEFQERGYVHGGRIYSDDEADELCRRLFDVMEGRSERKPENIGGWGKDGVNRVVQIVNIFEADDLFLRHIYHEAITEMAAQLMGTDTVRVWHDQVQYKPPRTGGPTDWHQDHPYWPIIQPADLVSAWLALDDADEANGCMSMVPGSHKWGPHKGGTIGTDPNGFTPTPDMSLVPEGAPIEIVPCPVKKGHVLFHHCLTWHGSPPNRSDRGRPGIAVHYMPGWTRYEPEGRTHLVEHNIEVAPGEVLEGKHFPTVRENGHPLTP